jgi:hypothetical protein
MFKKEKPNFFVFAVLLMAYLLAGCSSEIAKINNERLNDGLYDSEFPQGIPNGTFESILESVKLISTIAFYESFEFSRDSSVLKTDLDRENAEKKAIYKYHFNNPATGTATLIYHQNRKTALLTCAHIIDFPDSIVSYHQDVNGRNTKYVQKIAYKDRQNINIIDSNLRGNFDILAVDTERDIAIVGNEQPLFSAPILPVFRFPAGKAEELDWGNFVYIIGFPRGEKMITSGLISSPNRDKYHSFIVDAVFNRGFSGGIVLAIRDGVPNFELVGIAKSVPAESNLYLTPNEKFRLSETNIQQPFQSEIKVKAVENIYYGITYASSIESIRLFIERNKLRLIEKGYNIEYFF